LTKKTKNTKAKRSNPLPWVIGVVVILCLAVTGGIYWHRSNKVEHIQLTGLHFISQKKLKKQVDIPIGIKADSLDYAAISKKLKAVPYVQNVRFNMKSGGTLSINITERTPVALLIAGSKHAYIDKSGMLLPIKPGKAVNVPLLYGFSPKAKKDTMKAFKQTLRFLEDLHKNKAADATISGVVWNAGEGVIALTNSSGVKVIFGKSGFAKRLRNYDAFYRTVVRKEGISQFHLIDLRFHGQIVTRKD
jgi:cell division septal protein FtsQ